MTTLNISKPLLSSRWFPIPPHKVQSQIRLLRERRLADIDVPRFPITIAGRRAFKTETWKRELVMSLVEPRPHFPPRYFYSAPTREQAKRIAWQDLKGLTPREWLPPEGRGISETELCIRTVWGAELWVLGMDKPERVEGIAFDGGVMDEICDTDPLAFTVSVFAALADRNGWCARIGVPKRHGVGAKEVKRDFEKAGRGEDQDAIAYHWISADFLSTDAIEAAKRKLDQKTYREQFEASFEDPGGLIYYAFSREYNVRPCLIEPGLPLLVGSDFNVDPMCWVVAQKKGDRIEVVDELFLRACNTRMALDELWRRYKDHKGGWHFYGDSTAQGRRTAAKDTDYIQIKMDERFRKAGRGVHYPRHQPPPADRFAVVNSGLFSAAGRRRLFVDGKCERLIEDLEAVAFEPGTREAQKTGDLTHMTDGLGYMLWYVMPIHDTAGGEDDGEESDSTRFSV
jgi:hypothetical protein